MTSLSQSADSDNPYFLSDMFLRNATPFPGRTSRAIQPVGVRSGDQIQLKAIDYGEDPATNTNMAAATILPEDRGCSNPPNPSSSQSILNGAAANAENIAKTLGLSQPCVQAAKAKLTVSAGSQSWLDTLMGNRDKTNIDNQMMSSGCGSFSTSLNNVFNEMASLRCQYTSMTSNTASAIYNNVQVSVSINSPSAESVAAITEVAHDFDNQIRYYNELRPSPSDFPSNASLEVINAFTSSWERGRNQLVNAKAQFLADNPLTVSLTNSTITARSIASVKYEEITDLDATTAQNVMTSIENVATETAVQKIQQALGVHALPPNSREYIQNQVSNVTTTRETQIVNLINQNNLVIDQNSAIKIDIFGRVSNSTIDAMATGSVDVKVLTTLKSAVSIGETVASHIVTGLQIEQSHDTQSDGIDGLWADALDASTERARFRKDENETFWTGMWIVGAIIACVVLYFGYQYLTARTGGGIKGGMKYGRRY
jgi:hypothetical protein